MELKGELNTIDHIEALKGDESLFYGTDARVGVINIITKGITKETRGTRMGRGIQINIMLGMLLVILTPAIAMAGAYSLGIFGNANGDDAIDLRDVACVEGMISGLKPETQLADANYDGRIDGADITQIRLIISGEEKELTLFDSAHKIVTVKKPIHRIVTIGLYCYEPIRMMGDMDKIVAIEGDSKKAPVYFPQIIGLPSIGGYPPDFEVILNFKPDILIGSTIWTKHLYGKIPDTILPIVGLDFAFPVFFEEEIVKLGYILNKRDKAENYLHTFYHPYLDMLHSRTAKIPDQERLKVYIENSRGNYKAIGSRTQHLQAMGTKNIFADMPHYFQVDPEEVLERNPDIIIKQLRNGAGYMSNDTSVMANKREEIMNRPELANTKAVKNGDVYILAERIAYGCAYPVSVAYMAKLFYPELFKDFDPRAMHQTFIDHFCPGIDFNVYKQGVFFYPAIKSYQRQVSR